jgi:Plant mobile domain
MSVGEMTITLQDVACLWGLPVDGIPVTGVSDDDWTPLIKVSFGKYIDASAWITKGRGTRDQTVYTSRFSLKLSWLWEHFLNLSEDATPAQIDQYTRVFVMEMFGTILFPDSSSVGVPVVYLQFLTDLEHPPRYNWGAAVLAYLYRNLSLTSWSSVKSSFGPLILLQMWAWTWFSVSRLTFITPYDSWGKPDLDSCQPYGRYRTGVHHFIFYNLYFQFIFCNLY